MVKCVKLTNLSTVEAIDVGSTLPKTSAKLRPFDYSNPFLQHANWCLRIMKPLWFQRLARHYVLFNFPWRQPALKKNAGTGRANWN